LRRRVRTAHRAAARPALQPVLRLVLPAHARPEASLRELAANGATPRQMLWGIWWCHTVPALCRVLAAAAFGSWLVCELRS
jgi:hypothetical protein